MAVCYTTRPRLRQAKTPLSSIFLFLVPIPRPPHSAFRIPHSPFPGTSPGLPSVLIGSLSYLRAGRYQLFCLRTKRSAGALRKRGRIE